VYGRTERKAQHSPPSSADVNIVWSFRAYVTWCLDIVMITYTVSFNTEDAKSVSFLIHNHFSISQRTELTQKRIHDGKTQSGTENRAR